MIDVIVRGCGLSNVDGRDGPITRAEVRRSQLVGFGFERGEVRDVRVVDSSLELASFASGRLHNVVFERVNLAEVSFMDAGLEAMAFLDCRMAGVDSSRRPRRAKPPSASAGYTRPPRGCSSVG